MLSFGLFLDSIFSLLAYYHYLLACFLFWWGIEFTTCTFNISLLSNRNIARNMDPTNHTIAVLPFLFTSLQCTPPCTVITASALHMNEFPSESALVSPTCRSNGVSLSPRLTQLAIQYCAVIDLEYFSHKWYIKTNTKTRKHLKPYGGVL